MDEEVEEIWQILEKTYKKRPKLVLSVVGDSETFVPKVWSRDVFQTALIEAAKYSGGDTWILYCGRRKSTVSSMISEAFDTYTHLENLHSYPKEAESFPIKPVSLSSENDSKKDRKPTQLTGLIECMFHGYPEKFEEYRLQLESYIHNQTVSFMDEGELKLDLPIPVVRILVEGDLNSIHGISESVNRNLPVVIVKGSGKAADLIVDYIEKPESLKTNAALLFGIRFRNETFDSLRESLEQIKSSENLVNIFDVENKTAGSFLQVIGEAVVRASAYSQVSGKGKLKDTRTTAPEEPIACVNEQRFGRKKFKKRQFRKCLSTSDYIKQSDAMPVSVPLFFYFGYQYLQHIGKLLDYGYFLLYQALKTNRCDYVNALVSEEVKFKATYLAKLYAKTFPVTKTRYCCRRDWEDLVKIAIAPDTVLHVTEDMDFKPQSQKIEDEDMSMEEQKLDHYRKVSGAVRSLCCYLLKYNAEEEPKEMKRDKKWTDRSRSRRYTEKSTTRPVCTTESTDGEKSTNEYVLRPDIFNNEKQSGSRLDVKRGERKKKPSQDDINKAVLLWAIFAQREEIAELFWLHGNNHLVSSLICTVLLRKLSEKADDYNEHNLSRHFEEHAGLFEERVQMLLDLMYQENEKCAIAAMDEESTVFGVKTTPLAFAYENLLYDVIAHPCSQRYMDMVWHARKTETDNEQDDEVSEDKCVCGCFQPCCCKQDSFRPNWSPKIRYIINYVIFFGVLVSYSGFVLTSVSHSSYKQDSARAMEYIVYFWGVGDLLEEYRPFVAIFFNFLRDGKYRRFLFQLKLHLNDFWNAMDLLLYISIAFALGVRHAGDQQDFTWSRRIFSFSLLIMYMRFLQAFLMTRTFGATIIMIKEMLKDLLVFIWLAIFVIVGVGMYYHANLWPDHRKLFGDGSIETWRIWTIIALPYFQLYGDSNDDFFSGDDDLNCTKNEAVWSSDRCPQKDWTVMVIVAAFMLFSNLLLVNLVIAKF
ncbi:uncharacterized protein LOC134278929, partial [Saccostrea cucullata]|uniref:uncharacterized protein LOC134278929 n=1 Tax=Saccostrea cuccullata TaxID=36930 RepID=UPI002ECFBAB5